MDNEDIHKDKELEEIIILDDMDEGVENDFKKISNYSIKLKKR